MWGFDGNFFEGFSGFLDPFFYTPKQLLVVPHFWGTPIWGSKIDPFLYILFTLVLGHILHKKYVGI